MLLQERRLPPAESGQEILDGFQSNAQEDQLRAIDEMDLSMVKMKLCLPMEKEGKGWSQEEAEEAELWYKRFLKLRIITGNVGIVPTKVIDEMWHAHILDTRAYHQDCQKIFGHYLHHFPYFGLRGGEDAAKLQSSFHETCALFTKHFGESPLEVSSSTCGNRNCNGCRDS